MREVDAGGDPSAPGSDPCPESDAGQVARIAGDIAHDLNNLLAIVLGHCELVATEQNLPGRVRSDIAEISRAAQRGGALVNQLKALSRSAPIASAAQRETQNRSTEEDDPAKAAPVVASFDHASMQRHVLFLDDDAPLVFLAVQGLTRLGHRVSGFESADGALAALRADAGSFDLVVTDYTMPESSGLEVAAEVARLAPDLPVLLISGAVSEEMREACAQLGICEIAEKPIEVSDLCALIHAMLGRTRES